MPAYEMSVIVKAALSRPELTAALKRSCELIWKGSGVVRTIENLGERTLPKRMLAGDKSKYWRGHYFIVHLDVPVDKVATVKEELDKEPDLLRFTILKEPPAFVPPCRRGKECLFGELSVPDQELLVYKGKHLKKLRRQWVFTPNKKLDPERYESVPTD